jgi:hypothetical protein
MDNLDNMRKKVEEHIEKTMHVSSDERVKRLETCFSCPYFIKSNSRCGKCGCDMKIKTKFKKFKCPDGKF